MAKAYQYDASGYYVGEAEDYGLLPNNATRTEPPGTDGHIPRWNGSFWEHVEDHKGEQGYLHGEPYTIKDYGPYPAGWSATLPTPTVEEVRAAKYAEVIAGANMVKSALSSRFSVLEETTWPEQEAGARFILGDAANVKDKTARLILLDDAGTDNAVALVRQLAAVDGSTPEAFAARITANADLSYQAGIMTLLEQRGMEARLNAARTLEEVRSITVEYSAMA